MVKRPSTCQRRDAYVLVLLLIVCEGMFIDNTGILFIFVKMCEI